MWDIGCIAAGIAFFFLAIAYTTACDRLDTRLDSRLDAKKEA